jgi:hypothetical protein
MFGFHDVQLIENAVPVLDVTLASGFCECCCAPLMDDAILRADIDGREHMFCSNRCKDNFSHREHCDW